MQRSLQFGRCFGRADIDPDEQRFVCLSQQVRHEEDEMRAFISSCVAALVIALGAAAVLYYLQVPAEIAFSTSGVRL
jgi:hypothetical protein